MRSRLKEVHCDACDVRLTWKTLNVHGDQRGDWVILCNVCPGHVYHITGDRIDSLEKALTWTLHLSRKAWFKTSPWENVLYRMFAMGRVGGIVIATQ